MHGLSRKMLALVFAGALVAGACGSSTATTSPAGVSAAPGGQTTATAVATADADSVLTDAITRSSDIKSLHLSLTVAGSINEAALMAAISSPGAAPSAAMLKLDGTTVSGDIDVANKAADIKLTVPPIGTLTTGLTGEVIVVGGNLYYKTSLTGAKFFTTPLSGANLPIPSSRPEAITSLTLSDAITQLRASMASAGVSVALVGQDTVGGLATDHFSLTLPLDKINAALADQGGGLSLTSASVDFWLYTSDLSLAQVIVKGASGAGGDLTLTLTITNYNQPVTIAAPPASQIGTGSGLTLP